MSGLLNKKWHACLDQVPKQIQLREDDRARFEERLIRECNEAIRVVLDSISSLLESLRLGKI